MGCLDLSIQPLGTSRIDQAEEESRLPFYKLARQLSSDIDEKELFNRCSRCDGMSSVENPKRPSRIV